MCVRIVRFPFTPDQSKYRPTTTAGGRTSTVPRYTALKFLSLSLSLRGAELL